LRLQSLLRGRERHRVLRERSRRPAEDVPRKLIEQDHEGEATARRRPPLVELAPCRRLDRGAEAIADLGVERCILRVPILRIRERRGYAEPEREHIFRADHGAYYTTVRRRSRSPASFAPASLPCRSHNEGSQSPFMSSSACFLMSSSSSLRN